MKIQIASDLHLEFDSQKKWLENSPLAVSGDVLVLAGDISIWMEPIKWNDWFLDWATSNYKHVVMVHGNHSFYRNGDLARVKNGLIETIYPNLYYGYNTSVVLDGVEFVLSPLWSNIDLKLEAYIRQAMSDFKCIRYDTYPLTASRYNKLHRECVAFLEETFKAETTYPRVVVTHHAPSLSLESPKHQTSLLSSAFVSDLDHLIEKSKADYWVYGHTHTNIRGKIGETTLVSNQLGYVSCKEHISNKFSNSYVVEI